MGANDDISDSQETTASTSSTNAKSSSSFSLTTLTISDSVRGRGLGGSHGCGKANSNVVGLSSGRASLTCMRPYPQPEKRPTTGPPPNPPLLFSTGLPRAPRTATTKAAACHSGDAGHRPTARRPSPGPTGRQPNPPPHGGGEPPAVAWAGMSCAARRSPRGWVGGGCRVPGGNRRVGAALHIQRSIDLIIRRLPPALTSSSLLVSSGRTVDQHSSATQLVSYPLPFVPRLVANT